VLGGCGLDLYALGWIIVTELINIMVQYRTEDLFRSRDSIGISRLSLLRFLKRLIVKWF